MPDAATMTELINRYKDIILAGIEDGTEASEQELVIEGGAKAVRFMKVVYTRQISTAQQKKFLTLLGR